LVDDPEGRVDSFGKVLKVSRLATTTKQYESVPAKSREQKSTWQKLKPEAKAVKTAKKKARQKAKKLAARLAAENGSQAEATPSTVGGAPADSESEAGSAPADEVEAEAEPPT
jgi:hypothetical protein